jgi:hypothetical protein
MVVLTRVNDVKMAAHHTSYEYQVEHLEENKHLNCEWILDDCFVGKKEIERFWKKIESGRLPEKEYLIEADSECEDSDFEIDQSENVVCGNRFFSYLPSEHEQKERKKRDEVC